MKDEELKETIIRLLLNIAPDIEPDILDADENIREVYGIDSFDFLQFIVGLDEEFGIKTPEEDYGKVTTLSTLMNYIKLAKKKI